MSNLNENVSDNESMVYKGTKLVTHNIAMAELVQRKEQNAVKEFTSRHLVDSIDDLKSFAGHLLNSLEYRLINVSDMQKYLTSIDFDTTLCYLSGERNESGIIKIDEVALESYDQKPLI